MSEANKTREHSEPRSTDGREEIRRDPSTEPGDPRSGWARKYLETKSEGIKITCVAVFIALLLPLPWAYSRTRLGSVTYLVESPQIAKTDPQALFPFRTGQIVSAEEVESRINSLLKIGLFSAIDYELKPAGKGLNDLIITVSEARIIGDIRVKGGYPFLSKEIRKLISMQPGSAFDPGELALSADQVKEFMQKHGFYDSQVTVSERASPRPGKVDLVVRIKKGRTYRVRNVHVEGNTALQESRIVNKISKSSRFRPVRLKQNLKKIRRMYIRNGYVKAQVKLSNVRFDKERRKVDLTVVIKENKRLSLEFRGKQVFASSRIRRILNFDENRAYDRFAVEGSVERLKNYYTRNGFPDANVTAKIVKQGDNHVKVVYTIAAGRKVELTRIAFLGNKGIGGKRLKKQMHSRESGFLSRQAFDGKKLLRDRARIQNYYHERGFLDAEVSEPEVRSNISGDHRSVTYPVSEGIVYELAKVVVASDLPVDEVMVLKKSGIKTGKPYEYDRLKKSQEEVLEYLQKEGYAYAGVTHEVLVVPATHNVTLNINIVRDQKVRVRHIIVTGDDLTRRNVVTRNFKLREGNLFNYQEMLDGQLALRRLGIFSAVSVSPLGFETKSHEIDILIALNERKTVTTEMQVGFDTINLASGEIDFTKRNLFGLAKQFNARLIGGLKFDRAEGTFYSPRLFGASWNLANQYFGQYEDNRNFNATSFGGLVSVLKNYGPRWTVGFREQVTRTNVFEGSSNPAIGTSLFDNTLNEFQATVSFDIRDNYSDPQKGVNAFVRNELSTDLLNVSNNFYTFEFNFSHYQGFLKRFTLINTARYMQIFELSDDTLVPVNKLFFLGGDDTLRGFEQDAVNDSGGSVAILYNTELHFRLFDAFKLAGFFDTGLLTDDFGDINWQGWRESAGVGIRYFTPVGPVRLDLGFILDRQGSEPKQRLHFSFGYFF